MSDRGVLAVALVAAVVVTAAVVALRPGPVEVDAFAAGFGPGPVAAGTPQTAAWAAVVDDLAPGVVPGSPNDCVAGRLVCLDAVVAEMQARFDRLGCAHTAPFAFTYLEMTRGVQARVAEPGFFEDPAGLAHLDALFAQLYFDAFDSWEAGRLDHVPGAWQMAFEAAELRRSSAAADLLLGMNAHISRDLAYTVAMVLEAAPGAVEDPSDFALVNQVIGEVRLPMLRGAAARFDPTLAELDIEIDPSLGLDAVDLIGRWREEAFELGRRLAEAGDDQERLEVIAEIERNAVAGATIILNADATMGTGLPAEERLAHCEQARS
jgi:hypothetical protein